MKRILVLNAFLLLFVMQVVAQKQVTGVVTNSEGDPIPGASIIVNGTTKGVITDVDGNYQIDGVQDSDTLLVSFVGMLNELHAVGNQSIINIQMLEDIKSLQEIVVIGYGTQRKEAVTGSVANMKGDVIREVPSSDVSEALQGRIAGVQLNRTSTKPGAEMQIRIRGTRSLNASNDPLIVLDGIPFAGSINDINPGDIKSVDILKDASSTAIYGSRGANGVILISTNKGNRGQRAKITYDGYYGTKTAFGKYPMMSGPDFVALRERANLYTNGADESDDVDYDWQDGLYTPAITTSHNLGVRGGTENAAYSFGVGYYKDEAIIPLQDFSRYSIHASADQNIGKYIKVGFSSQNNYSVTNGDNLGIGNAIASSPIANPKNDDGTTKQVISMAADDYWTYSQETLENLGDGYISETKNYGTYNNIYGEFKIPGVEGLKYRVNIGLNYRSSNRGRYEGEGVFSSNPMNPSTASITNSLKTSWVVENLLTYDRTFKEKHNVNFVALYSNERESYNKSDVAVKDIPSDAFQFYNLGRAEGTTTIDPGNQDYYQSGLRSMMARAMYAYDNKYMVSVAIRRDGSSRLAEGHKWHAYPAISAGWNVSEEAFLENVSWLNALKLRLGYGQTSNQSVDPYKTFGRLTAEPYNFGNQTVVGKYASELPNDQLGWEYSETWNYGIDFSLLNARVSGTFEYYTQKTSDLLLSVSMPNSSGVDSYIANVGKTENKGIEISLNGTILDNYAGWTWDIGFNLYANNNKLVELASGRQIDITNNWFVGSPINVVYDYEKVGLWNEGDEGYEHLEVYEPGGNEGMIRVKYNGDFNADGSPTRAIGPDDRQIIELDPDFLGGFNTRVAYKGFDLSIIGAYQKGGTLISTLYGTTSYLNLLSGRRGQVDVDYWTEDNKGAKYPDPTGLRSGDHLKYTKSCGYFDASYLKIRAITLGYNLKSDWSDKIGVDRFRVYATIQNPFVMFSPYHKESGMDPETNSKGDENQAVNDDYKQKVLVIATNTPSTRNFLFGINLTF